MTIAKHGGLSELRRRSCESGKTIMAEGHRTQYGRGEAAQRRDSGCGGGGGTLSSTRVHKETIHGRERIT